MKFLKLQFILALAFLFNSCHNKLELNAPYKEIPSIYAILSPSDSVQMIRINKIFLGEGNATQMAKISDSINYPEGELAVQLTRYVDGVAVPPTYNAGTNTVVTFSERMIEAQPGAFSTHQRVYVFRDSIYDNGEYHLTVRNNHTGNVFHAKTNSLKKVIPYFPPLGEQPYYPYPLTTQEEKYINYSGDPKPPYEIRYLANESYAYQLVIRFHIDEDDFKNGRRQLLDYNAGTRTLREATKFAGGTIQYISHTFSGSGIFAAVGNEVSKWDNNIAGRKVVIMEYIIYTANREYMDYLEYLKPSLSINQNKPLYSNFDDGAALGIFSIRNRVSFKKQPSTFYINRFSDHPSTCSYKFFDQYNVVRGCK
jgi:hypothetical protein